MCPDGPDVQRFLFQHVVDDGQLPGKSRSDLEQPVGGVQVEQAAGVEEQDVGRPATRCQVPLLSRPRHPAARVDGNGHQVPFVQEMK